MATIKVYGAKTARLILSNPCSDKRFDSELAWTSVSDSDAVRLRPSSNGSAMPAPMMNSHQDASKMNAQMPSANQDEMKSKMPAASQDKDDA